MSGLSFKSAVLSLAIVCFLAGSARADSITFTGEAALGNDLISFFLSGPSFSIHSASPGGPAGGFFGCFQGTLCNVPAEFVQATFSYSSAPGDFSGGTVGDITAYTLTGGLIFSGSSFTAGVDPNNFGSGPVTFTGDLTGFVFLPLGCEKSSTCTDFGPQVFHLHLSGTGIVTASGVDVGNGQDEAYLLTYNFRGTAATAPEPSSLLLVSSGLAGLVGLTRWRLRWRVGN
jgi:hypothetical protein